MNKPLYTPIEVGVALSLYAYNVNAHDRATELYRHFGGNCAEMSELIDILLNRGTYTCTELAMPTALVYVQHALDKYGEEARLRVDSNLGPLPYAI